MMVYDANEDGHCDVCGERCEEECGCTRRDYRDASDEDAEYYGR